MRPSLQDFERDIIKELPFLTPEVRAEFPDAEPDVSGSDSGHVYQVKLRYVSQGTVVLRVVFTLLDSQQREGLHLLISMSDTLLSAPRLRNVSLTLSAFGMQMKDAYGVAYAYSTDMVA